MHKIPDKRGKNQESTNKTIVPLVELRQLKLVATLNRLSQRHLNLCPCSSELSRGKGMFTRIPEILKSRVHGPSASTLKHLDRCQSGPASLPCVCMDMEFAQTYSILPILFSLENPLYNLPLIKEARQSLIQSRGLGNEMNMVNNYSRTSDVTWVWAILNDWPGRLELSCEGASKVHRVLVGRWKEDTF